MINNISCLSKPEKGVYRGATKIHFRFQASLTVEEKGTEIFCCNKLVVSTFDGN